MRYFVTCSSDQVEPISFAPFQQDQEKRWDGFWTKQETQGYIYDQNTGSQAELKDQFQTTDRPKFISVQLESENFCS